MVTVVTGVAGSGKTTIGKLLAETKGWDFYDADDFHPPDNVAKMRSGIPLSDADRYPWLRALVALIEQSISDHRSIVLACSALKASYRKCLRSPAHSSDSIQIVYLKISPSTATERLNNRKGHFMPATLIQSQFEALEEPSRAIVIDAALPPDQIIAEILKSLPQS
jgi:gluconokinase